MANFNFEDHFLWKMANPEEAGKTVLSIMNGETEYPGCFVEFVASWCGHCKRHIPSANISAVTMGHVYRVPVIPIAGDTDSPAFLAVSSKLLPLKPKGFPTIMMVSNDGRVQSYEGNRTPEDMEKSFLDFHPTTKRFKIPESAILAELKSTKR